MNIIEMRNEFNAKLSKIELEKETVMKPLYIEYINNNKDKLIGVRFPTGNIDDEYEVKEVEDDTLILTQTWDGVDTEDIEIEELDISQLEIIHLMLSLKK